MELSLKLSKKQNKKNHFKSIDFQCFTNHIFNYKINKILTNNLTLKMVFISLTNNLILQNGVIFPNIEGIFKDYLTINFLINDSPLGIVKR